MAGAAAVVVADDRTGAWEVAGALAEAGWGQVPVLASAADVERVTPARAVVVDIASRHLDGEDAARAAAATAAASSSMRLDPMRPDPMRLGHKIDSTLRGNWADELAARHACDGRPVLVVAALPSQGRTCIGGIVREHGVPVHEGAAGRDPRRPLSTSSPAEMLRRAGATDVSDLVDATTSRHWFAAPHGVAVHDAASAADLAAIGTLCRQRPDVVVAGTAAAIAAALRPDPERRRSPAPAREARRLSAAVGAVVVACGSLHPAARHQVERAAIRGAVVVQADLPAGVTAIAAGADPAVRVVVTTPDVAGEISERAATAMAERVAAATHGLVERLQPVAVVLIGGDTAAAFLGSDPMVVEGTVGPGTAWGRLDDGTVVVTRAGGFGGADHVVDLLWGTLAP